MITKCGHSVELKEEKEKNQISDFRKVWLVKG